MALEAGLRTLLLAQSPITTLCPAQIVKGVSHYGVFVGRAAQGFAPPFIVITRTEHDPYATLDGTTGMGSSEIDIDCFEATHTKAEALATAVVDFLKDYSGAAGATDIIDAVILLNRRSFQTQAGSGNDEWQYVVTLTFQIQHH